MKKSDVNGDNTNPVYKWLKNEKAGIMGLTRIKVRKLDTLLLVLTNVRGYSGTLKSF